MAKPPSKQKAKVGCPVMKPKTAIPTTGSNTQSKAKTFAASTCPGYLRLMCAIAAFILKLRLLILPYHNTHDNFRKIFAHNPPSNTIKITNEANNQRYNSLRKAHTLPGEAAR